MLEKKILSHFLFLHSLPDLFCDQLCVTRLPNLHHLVLPVPSAGLFGVVVASDNLMERVACAFCWARCQPPLRWTYVWPKAWGVGVFLFLLEASLKGQFSLCITCTEAFRSSQNKPWQNKPFCMQSVLQNVVFLKCANQGNKIDPVFNKCSIESCGKFKKVKNRWRPVFITLVLTYITLHLRFSQLSRCLPFLFQAVLNDWISDSIRPDKNYKSADPKDRLKCLFPERTLQRNYYLQLNSWFKNI